MTSSQGEGGAATYPNVVVASGAPRAGDALGALPAEVSSLVGRRRELTDVKQLFSTYRLVALTGPGGVGKTRLAVRVARDMSRSFRGRMWFVELAELREAALLANTVADSLGLYDQSKRPTVEAVTEYLGGRPGFLVLDNVEHLVEACATFVDTLLKACGELRVLVTGRQPLGLVGEGVYVVPPLGVPDPQRLHSPEAASRRAAVRLFVERATAVHSEFRLDEDNYRSVARLCHDLDGLPLAIEMAALRLRSLSVQEVAQRVSQSYGVLHGARGAPARHHSLSALIDWSYELCSPPERLVWARVSVFAGGFDLDAAEYVAAGGDVDRPEVLPLVEALIDKSIVLRHGDGNDARYVLLEIVREYGLDKLADSGEVLDVRERHRDYYAQQAKRFAAEWMGPDQLAWVRRLRRERANRRAALEYCASQPDEAIIGLRMAADINQYWLLRGLYVEASYWLDRLLASVPQPCLERLSGLRMDARFALMRSNTEASHALLAEATELAEELGDDTERSYLALLRGIEAVFTGDLPQAITLLRAALTGFRAAGEVPGELEALCFLGLSLGVQGQREQALALLDECLQVSLRLGEQFWCALALWSLAHIEVLYDEGLERAETSGREALRMQHALGNRLAVAFNLDTLAWIATRRGEHSRAATLFGTAHTAWHAIGSAPENYALSANLHDDHLTRARQALSERAFETAFTRGQQMPTDEAIAFALEAKQPAPAPSPVAEASAEAALTRREQEIADLVAQGLSNKAIAATLIISQRTAETHVEHILTKLGFTKRAQIASWIAGHYANPGGTT